MTIPLCRLAVVCGIFFSANEATGAEPVSNRQTATLSSSGQTGVEYLSSPLDEVRVDAYRQLLKEKLFTSPGDCGVFVMIPTGFPEWAVSASTERGQKHGAPTFWLSLTSATSNLYESHFASEPVNADVRVNEVRVQIDRIFALAIQNAWRAILSKDPLPSEDPTSVILDGYSADLSVRMRDGKVIARTTSNPKAPPAAELVNSGYELREYCLASANERSNKRRAAIDKLNRITERFGENGSSLRNSEQPRGRKQRSDASIKRAPTSETLALISNTTEQRPNHAPSGNPTPQRRDVINQLSPTEQRIVGAWSWTYIEGVGRIIFTSDHKLRIGFPPALKDGRKIGDHEFDIVQSGVWRLDGDALVTEIDNTPLIRIIEQLDPSNIPALEKTVERRRIVKIDSKEIVFDDGSSFQRVNR